MDADPWPCLPGRTLLTVGARRRFGAVVRIVLALVVLASAGLPARALTIGASTTSGAFSVGSHVTISLELGLAPGETLSALEVSFRLVGISSVSAPVLSYDPGGLFPAGAFGNLAGDLLTLSLTRNNSDVGGFIAQISFDVQQSAPFHVVLESALAARDIPSTPFFEDVPVTPFDGTPLLALGAPNPISVFEDFEGLAVQSDTTGQLVQGVRVYSVSDGSGSVASAEGALAAGVEIASEPGNLFWRLSSSQGDAAASSGFALIGDLPAMDGGVLSGAYAGALATPVDLVATQLDARIRSPLASGETSVRAVLMDSQGREVATPLFALGAAFQNYSFAIDEDFGDLLGGASGFDFTQVAGVALEFHSGLATAPAYAFDVDEIALPEPAAGLLSASALLCLGLLARRG